MGELRQGGNLTVVEGGRNGRLLIICAADLTAAEWAARATLPAGIAVELVPGPDIPSLAVLCRHHACALIDTVVIATRPPDLPLLLQAHAAIALAGAGYENEAAADRVFPSRSAGGLVQAIRYVGSLGANR